MTPEHKQKLKEGREKKMKESGEQKYVTVDQFSSLVDVVTKVANSVDSLAKKEEPVKEESAKAVIPSEEAEKPIVPPKWREIVDEELGRSFGINVVYPGDGKGFLMKIIVPKEKSNAPQSHWEFYRTDIRTKALGYGEGIEGIRNFCIKIRGNLKMEKHEVNK